MPDGHNNDAEGQKNEKRVKQLTEGFWALAAHDWPEKSRTEIEAVNDCRKWRPSTAFQRVT